MNFDDQIGSWEHPLASCRDKGQGGVDAGALCLSCSHHDSSENKGAIWPLSTSRTACACPARTTIRPGAVRLERVCVPQPGQAPGPLIYSTPPPVPTDMGGYPQPGQAPGPRPSPHPPPVPTGRRGADVFCSSLLRVVPFLLGLAGCPDYFLKSHDRAPRWEMARSPGMRRLPHSTPGRCKHPLPTSAQPPPLLVQRSP
jgi:hypothetical protein